MVGKGWRACLRKWNGGFFESQEGERRCRRQGREGGVAQVEGDSNRHPIAIQSRSNRPNSTTPTRIVASNCPLFPQILCSDFIPNEQPHLAWPAATIPTTCTPGHAPPSSHPQASAAICNLHPAGSFASQQPPERASPQKARPSHALSSLQPSRPITHLALELQSLSFHSLSFSTVPESVWAKGSSNSGRLSNILTIFTSSHPHILTSSHLLIFTSSHLHICSSSHLLTSSHPHIFTSSHLHIFSSSHLLIFTSSHLHILTSLHFHIFSASHPHILTSSNPHIFTSSHLHICSSSHLLIFTSSHLHIFSPLHTHTFISSHPHILTSSHLLILTSSHLHILTSSHLLIFTSSHSLLPSCSLALLLAPSFLFLSWRRGAVPTRWHETQPFRAKWGSIAKNWSKIAISKLSGEHFRTKWGSLRFDRQKLR